MIYFLRAGEHVKIGRTKDAETLRRRVAMLQTGQAHRLSVLRTIDAPDWAEGWLHGFFAGVRAAGEWFRYQPEMMAIEPPAEMPRRSASSLSTLFKLWIPNDLFKVLEQRAKQSGVSKAQVLVDAMRECWGVAEPAARDPEKSDKAA